MKYAIYQLADGRRWDVETATWLAADAAIPDDADVITLISAEGRSDEKYLAETLEFYGYPLGELAWNSIPAIKRELANLDAEYLTPRTLGGLAVNDAEAKTRWDEHEAKAAPLRARLAELEAQSALSAESRDVNFGADFVYTH